MLQHDVVEARLAMFVSVLYCNQFALLMLW